MAADELSKDIEQAADICALAVEGGDGEQMAYLLAELVERHGAQGVNGAVESLGQSCFLEGDTLTCAGGDGEKMGDGGCVSEDMALPCCGETCADNDIVRVVDESQRIDDDIHGGRAVKLVSLVGDESDGAQTGVNGGGENRHGMMDDERYLAVVAHKDGYVVGADARGDKVSDAADDKLQRGIGISVGGVEGDGDSPADSFAIGKLLFGAGICLAQRCYLLG